MKQIIEKIYEFDEKKSTFITYTYKISNEEDALIKINSVKDKYPDARHVAYAYVLHKDLFKYSDDGEPKNTAGKPIFNIFEKNEFVYSLAIVVRYFGGIKLGAGGLIRNYPKGLKELVNAGEFEQYIPTQTYTTSLSIKEYNIKLKSLNNFDFKVTFNGLEVNLSFTLSEDDYTKLREIIDI